MGVLLPIGPVLLPEPFHFSNDRHWIYSFSAAPRHLYILVDKSLERTKGAVLGVSTSIPMCLVHAIISQWKSIDETLEGGIQEASVSQILKSFWFFSDGFVTIEWVNKHVIGSIFLHNVKFLHKSFLLAHARRLGTSTRLHLNYY